MRMDNLAEATQELQLQQIIGPGYLFNIVSIIWAAPDAIQPSACCIGAGLDATRRPARKPMSGSDNGAIPAAAATEWSLLLK